MGLIMPGGCSLRYLLWLSLLMCKCEVRFEVHPGFGGNSTAAPLTACFWKQACCCHKIISNGKDLLGKVWRA